jgi:DNA-binding NarL/FixJ family response regulator
LVGYTTPQIAELLNLSTRTVETHIDKIKKKLQCRTKGDIIVTAMKTGMTYSLLDDDAWS